MCSKATSIFSSLRRHEDIKPVVDCHHSLLSSVWSVVQPSLDSRVGKPVASSTPFVPRTTSVNEHMVRVHEPQVNRSKHGFSKVGLADQENIPPEPFSHDDYSTKQPHRSSLFVEPEPLRSSDVHSTTSHSDTHRGNSIINSKSHFSCMDDEDEIDFAADDSFLLNDELLADFDQAGYEALEGNNSSCQERVPPPHTHASPSNTAHPTSKAGRFSFTRTTATSPSSSTSVFQGRSSLLPGNTPVGMATGHAMLTPRQEATLPLGNRSNSPSMQSVSIPAHNGGYASSDVGTSSNASTFSSSAQGLHKPFVTPYANQSLSSAATEFFRPRSVSSNDSLPFVRPTNTTQYSKNDFPHSERLWHIFETVSKLATTLAKKKNHPRDSRREERCSTCDIMLDQARSAQGKSDPRLSATFALR